MALTSNESKNSLTRAHALVNGSLGLLWAVGLPALAWALTNWPLWIKVAATVLWLVPSPVIVDRCIPRVTGPIVDRAWSRQGRGTGQGGGQGMAAVFKEPEIPDVGKRVDRSFVVELPAAIDGPLLTVIADKAKIQVPRVWVEQTAAKGGTAWKTEEERQELIAADDAKELLGLSRSGPVQAASLKHSRYLVADALRSGVCMVVPDGASMPAARIVVRYIGEHVDELVGHGMVLFLLQDPPRTFFNVDWFVA